MLDINSHLKPSLGHQHRNDAWILPLFQRVRLMGGKYCHNVILGWEDIDGYAVDRSLCMTEKPQQPFYATRGEEGSAFPGVTSLEGNDYIELH